MWLSLNQYLSEMRYHKVVSIYEAVLSHHKNKRKSLFVQDFFHLQLHNLGVKA